MADETPGDFPGEVPSDAPGDIGGDLQGDLANPQGAEPHELPQELRYRVAGFDADNAAHEGAGEEGGEEGGGPEDATARASSHGGGPQVDPLALVGTAVDLALGVVALGVDVLKQAPEVAAELAATLPARAQQEYQSLLVRGSALRGNLGGLLIGRLLGPPIVEDEPAEVDPFDLLLNEDPVDLGDDLDNDLPPEPPRTPLVVVTPAGGPAPVPTGDLPLEGFDEMTIGTLRVSARQLGIADLETLLAHERGHGRRDGVLSLLETRIAQLQQEQSAG